jgi:methanogenic corrinoid protein MtbC1
VLIGGSAFRAAPRLWTEIGADGFAPDLRGAVEVADRLVSK